MQHDAWLMLLAAGLLACAMLGLPYLGELRAWYNRYSLGRYGPQVVQSLSDGELRALTYQRDGVRTRFTLEAVIHPPSDRVRIQPPATRFRFLVDLDCMHKTSMVVSRHSLSNPVVSLPIFFNTDRYPVANGAGWRYSLQQQFCG